MNEYINKGTENIFFFRNHVNRILQVPPSVRRTRMNFLINKDNQNIKNNNFKCIILHVSCIKTQRIVLQNIAHR